MRSFLLAIALGLASLTAPATAQTGGYQPPNLTAQRQAMARLEGLVGAWQGEAQVISPHAMTVYQSERVEFELDGLVLVIRGTGHADADRSGAPVFQAFGVISYDERRQLYDVRTYTGGHIANATGEFLADGSFRWSFAAGPMLMRYTISFDATTWREIGEMSRDGGATWTRTIELALTRTP